MGQEFGQGLARGFFCSVWHQLGAFTQLVAGLEGGFTHMSGTLACLHVASHQHDNFRVFRFLTWPLASKREKGETVSPSGLWSFRMSLLVTVGQSKSQGQPRFKELGYKHHILMGGVTRTERGKDLMAAIFGGYYVAIPTNYHSILIFNFIYKVLL